MRDVNDFDNNKTNHGKKATINFEIFERTLIDSSIELMCLFLKNGFKMIHSRVQYIYVMTIILRKDRRIIDSYVTSYLNWFVTGSRVNKHRRFDYFARRVKMSNHAWMYGPSTSVRCFEEDSFAEKREEMRFTGAARSLNYAYRVTTASNRWLEATVRVGRNRHVDVRVRRPGSHISYLYHHTLITIQGVLEKQRFRKY